MSQPPTKRGYRTEYKSCKGHVPFVTEGEARERARYLQKRAGGAKRTVWKCEFCGYYHFGTKRRRKGKPK